MSETTPQLPPEDANEPQSVKDLRAALQRAEARANEATEAANANAGAARKLAFQEAGVDLTNPSAALLLKTYDGELTPEAIKAEAQQYGLVAPEAPPAPDPTASPGGVNDPQQTQVRNQLGAEVIDPATPMDQGDPMEGAMNEFRRLKATGQGSDKAAAAVFGKMFEQAREGNPDFVFDAQTWQASEDARSR